ncbi:DUF1802 family protein [Lyngbya confervoides]|uniref:DUF1802 family protein n=1 Tax=Lyngbya confervoides BDU141951 TaxID=1574623 RepID=A0ABD4T6M5_9CYAN|nr:DUF1802 family protein [Lyngbya confervoides]MCM1984116.1 DUF1802 family protein [Lyngbya confervoides BDU141951]
MTCLHIALKEWSTAIDAIEVSKTILLFRKGGIHEPRPGFQVQLGATLLFPTFSHQSSACLKPEWARLASSSQSVRLKLWAEVTDWFILRDPGLIPTLSPFHVWTDAFLEQRLAWKPERPLYVVLCRFYQLRPALPLPDLPQSGGCRSWLNLEPPITVEATVPLVSEANYRRQCLRIQRLMQSGVDQVLSGSDPPLEKCD